MRFLKIVGFNFETASDIVELSPYRKESLEGAQTAINAHILSLGGQVETNVKFNPYESGFTAQSMNKLSATKDEKMKDGLDIYDPT